MRWSLRLSEFDFVVEHRARTKIKHVDALNRHVGAIMGDSLPDKQGFREEQKQDSFCSTRKIGTLSSKRVYFLDEDGILYRRQYSGNHQLVVQTSLIREVIRANHNPVFVAHPGMKRNFDLISLSYWWPGRRKSVEDCRVM